MAAGTSTGRCCTLACWHREAQVSSSTSNGQYWVLAADLQLTSPILDQPLLVRRADFLHS